MSLHPGENHASDAKPPRRKTAPVDAAPNGQRFPQLTPSVLDHVPGDVDAGAR